MRAQPAGPANRPSSTFSLVVGRRRRPIDGLSIGQTDSYVAKRGGSLRRGSGQRKNWRNNAPTAGPATTSSITWSVLLISDGWTEQYGMVVMLADSDPVRLEFVRDLRRP
jgi:hypothetical protein